MSPWYPSEVRSTARPLAALRNQASSKRRRVIAAGKAQRRGAAFPSGRGRAGAAGGTRPAAAQLPMGQAVTACLARSPRLRRRR